MSKDTLACKGNRGERRYRELIASLKKQQPVFTSSRDISTAALMASCLIANDIARASIDLEPKIRTIGKNTIFLPKKNQTFFHKKILN